MLNFRTKARLSFSLLSLILVSCYTIDYSKLPSEGWPTLQITEYFDASDKMPPGSLGYAWVDLDNGTCDMYFVSPNPAQWVRQHELAHCAGYDHIGDNFLSTLFHFWKTK